MLSKYNIDHLVRGTKVVHRLGVEMIFLSLYPMVNEPSTLECRYLNKDGEFKIGRFHPEELEMK